MSELTAEAYGLVVRFELRTGHEQAFDDLVSSTVERIAADETDTLMYVICAEVGSPSVRVFYELYHDRAAFDAHEETPHARRFLAERAQHLLSDPQVWKVSPVSGVVRHPLNLRSASPSEASD